MDFCSIGQAASAPSIVTPANPAPAANFSFAPASPFSVTGISYLLTTSANVGNRFAGVSIGGVVVSDATAQAAGLAQTYSAFPGAPAGALTMPIPSGTFPAGTPIASAVTGLLAGDQISAITLALVLYSQQATPL